ncbi:MAG: UDP-N-acetylmuramoyl-tripeptide--D-alanyl-D-alanine ligase [Candidatus Omnitrophica bacterium]|nr:UDP-N-acetylmuramoyl-tripeptide--D-alanyl-D-alanine ligase [Candidatus Omnitrophota bacterium]
MQLKEIVKAAGGKALDFKNADIKGISIDSRTIKRGELFIAIKGERFDGHDFVGEAFKKDAAAAVVQDKIRPKGVPSTSIHYTGSEGRNTTEGSEVLSEAKGTERSECAKRLIIVKDTLKALGDVAHYHRMKFKTPVIGVTGSTGKTTVKEIISYVLGQKYNVLKNDGTRNNLIGLPLTLLNLNNKHQMSCLEMGANHLREIKRLSEIAKPAIGVITNISVAHLEFFGSIHNVFKAKSELLNSLDGDSLALLNKDDEFLARAKTKCKRIYFGIDSSCEFRATHIEKKHNKIIFKVKGFHFTITLLGRHNIYNALAGIAIGQIFGIKLNSISRALENFKVPFGDRLALSGNNYLSILNDTYNSNPLSFEVALESLMDLRSKRRKVIISADMLELGKKSKYFHETLGKHIAQSDASILITLGPMSRYTSDSAIKNGMRGSNVSYFNNRESLFSVLPGILRKDDIVLVKGSRAMHMEEVVEKIQNIRK